MTTYPVILCGGAGLRLWPSSRPERPKQFLSLLGELSLFQETVRRLERLKGAAAPVIVSGERHLPVLQEQLAQIGRELEIIVEPEGRDSAAAIAAATAFVERREPGGVVLAVSSDHHIPDGDAFSAVAARAVSTAAAGFLTVLGITPTSPVTGYGYIQPGAPVGPEPGARAVERFIEKPDRARAEALVAAGYLWNSGIFAFQASTMAAELERHAPAVIAAARAGLDEADVARPFTRLGPAFAAAPRISIDYAVMEKTTMAAMVPAPIAWSDLGDWKSVFEAAPRDADGNATFGDVTLSQTRNVLARSEGPRLLLVGVQDVAVIATGDAVLVCALPAAAGIKASVEALEAARADAGGAAP